MSRELRAIEKLMALVTKCGFLLALALAIVGTALVYSGSTGTTEITLFGQSMTSQNVGVSAIFISVVMVVLIIRRVLTTVDTVVGLESKALHEPIPQELGKRHNGNKVSAIKEMRASQDT